MGQDVKQDTSTIGESKIAELCPYCKCKNFVKRGTRNNRYQVVQLYLCKNEECARTFTAQDVKGKHFPLNIVIEGMSYYNLGFSLEETCRILKSKFSVNPDAATLSSWINEYSSLCRYERIRPYATKMCKPKDTIEVVTMAHRQLYRFRYHRPKTTLMLTEFRNRNLGRLKEYLDAVSSETPHQYFQDGERMSDVRSKFSTADMIVRSKTNYANRLASFVLQTVSENKMRHEALQRFFIANDSCTVAT
jgi:transposase-like protein